MPQEVLVVAGYQKEEVQGAQAVSMVQVVSVEVSMIVEVVQVVVWVREEALEDQLSLVVQLVLSNLQQIVTNKHK